MVRLVSKTDMWRSVLCVTLSFGLQWSTQIFNEKMKISAALLRLLLESNLLNVEETLKAVNEQLVSDTTSRPSEWPKEWIDNHYNGNIHKEDDDMVVASRKFDTYECVYVHIKNERLFDKLIARLREEEEEPSIVDE